MSHSTTSGGCRVRRVLRLSAMTCAPPLKLARSVLPVDGWFSHGFGWRKDPWSGDRQFHRVCPTKN